MELLLAAFLMAWGGVSADHPDATFEQVAQASIDSKTAVAQQPSPDGNLFDRLTPVDKKDPQKDAPKVKGIYVTAHSAGGSRMNTLLKLMDDTELNSMVIDLKDDWGYITYDTGNPELNAMETTQKIITDMPKLMSTLQEHQVYPIARIVVFKDTVLAKKRPDLSFVNPDGSVWGNGKNPPESFVNPYKKEVWDYNIAIAKEAAKAGFKEIQFDYVRFPEGFEKRADTLKYDKDERSRIEAVAEFVKYAREQLTPLGVRVSVDIFGYAASVPAAEGIGQDFQKISQNVDVICPMIYPSHYSNGWYGAKVPDAAPYVTINGAMKDTAKKLDPLQSLKPVVRPWIQDFTATWVPGHIRYGKKEIEEQVRALKDNGIEEFLLWNAVNTYTTNVDYK
ncbi:putative glycoside hydrolase [Paenibacillus ehimensis]|uniref:Glycoside hydrolase n=1 Tax=Paenibacillus ehimensis TaxID=79264 RepID=A0ABT8VBR5_9BACL|nr:putative glycoside hydrolase [Paenibacillus ehimensis]MDO3678391.1 putative glycoside hydrolase [Paenibacillus ehimensis]MEC0211637.1 putative glycoside hydrolase [Paenibacillus ehimensis]